MLEQSTKEVFKILDSNLKELERRIEKINKRAKRIGVSEFALINFGQEEIENGRYVQRVHQVLLVGEPPKLNDWEFLATLDHSNEVGTVVRSLPGVQVDESYRNVEPFCEHCYKNRRRHSTYVVRHLQTGETKQVGRSCLADFTGVLDPAAICSYAELFILATEMMRETEASTFIDQRFICLEQYLYFVVQEITQHGWCSRQQARKLLEEGIATKATADTALNNYMSAHSPSLDSKTMQIAKKTIEWVRESIANKSVKSEYEHNISIIFASSSLDVKSIGLAASAVQGYYQAAIQKTENTVVVGSQYIGKVGDRIEEKVELFVKHPVKGYQGAVSWLHRFVDSRGNQMTWFSSKETEMEVAEAYVISARVKKHDVFKGTNVTVVTRVTLLHRVNQ